MASSSWRASSSGAAAADQQEATQQPPIDLTPSPVVDYAPSPNTSQSAVSRANQLRIQSLLRRLLLASSPLGSAKATTTTSNQEEEWRRSRIDTLRVLRKTLRELDFKLSWITQVDLLDTMERILRDDCADQRPPEQLDWRLVHDCTQLLAEAIPRLAYQPLEQQTLEQLLPMVVQNLGHERSEVRRSSLLLLNMLINEQRQQYFETLLKLFIEFGLSNYCNVQAQRGAILSLPLLMNEQVVERHDFAPLIRCLGELLVESDEHLFYSLFLAMQRLHAIMGDERFSACLRQCGPEALHLYRQAASRNNSLVATSSVEQRPQKPQQQQQQRFKQRSSSIGNQQAAAARGLKKSSLSASQPRVTFEGGCELAARSLEQRDKGANEQQNQRTSADKLAGERDLETKKQDQKHRATGCSSVSLASSESSSGSSSSLALSEDERKLEERRQQSRRKSGFATSSDVSSTCSSDAHLVDPAHYMSQAALSGRPMDNYEQIHHIDHSNVASLAINDMGLVCNTPTVELGPGGVALIDSSRDASESSGCEGLASSPSRLKVHQQQQRNHFKSHGEMKFGIFPRHLVHMALGGSPRYSDRLDAMQELMCIVRESPVNHLAILMSYFDQFLEQFLARLMVPNGDYKLELIAVDMLETIVVKTKVSTMQYVRPIVGLLVKTLVDSRAQQVFRAQSCRVLHKMMAYLPPQHLIDALFEHKHSRNVLVREEIINRVTGAVLEYDRNEFNLTKLCYHVLPMLADSHSSVRLAALECIATLAHALGPERIGSLLTAAEAVQTGCDYDGLLDAISARLRRHTLPRCNQTDGSIRHVLRSFLGTSAQQLGQQVAADVRWVLEAPSSHQHSPGPFHSKAQHQARGADEFAAAAADNQHHHHRLGVYSPPSVAQRRRRSSVGLAGLVGCSGGGSSPAECNHRHHHEQHHHERELADEQAPDGSIGQPQPEAGPENSAPRDKVSELEQCARPATPPRQPQVAARRTSCAARREAALSQRSETIDTCNSNATLANSAPIKDEQLLGTEANGGFHQVSEPEECGISRNFNHHQSTSYNANGNELAHLMRGRLASAGRNSQDSISSNDSNKILFQYYLGKFRQSLAEATLAHQSAVLPSDSIIYTDINQAYELSRRQSRYQQTSFDNANEDSNGQATSKAGEQQQVGRQAVPNNSIGPLEAREPMEVLQRQQQQESLASTPETSGTDSQLTVMEVSKEARGSQEAAVAAAETRRRQSVSRTAASNRRSSLKRVSSSSKSQSQESGAEQRRTPNDRASNNARPLEASLSGQAVSKPRQLVRQEASAAEQRANDSAASDKPEGLTRQVSNATNSSVDSAGDNRQQADAERSSRRRSAARRQSRTRDEAEAAEEEEDEEVSRAIRRRESRSQPPSRASQAPVAQQQEQQELEERVLSRTASKHSFGAPAKERSSGSRAGATTRAINQHAAPPKSQRRAISVSPSLACNVNIRHVLESVAEIEGPFVEPQLALKVALGAIESPCWSTKVEGIMALIRLINFHQQLMLDSGHLHELVCHVTEETRNLRSTVARSAIFALGELCAKLKRSIEPQMELIVQALLNKSIENTAFIREDIRRSLAQMVDSLTPWRLATSLIHHGAAHKSVHVRRMASQFVAQLVELMGPAKCLVGAKEIHAQLIPAAAKFAQDNSPFTRYYGRQILAKLMQHGSFDRLLRQNLTPNLYRSTLGIIESVKRRGPGELPTEN